MIRILSIDFDYFIKVTSEQRDELFPNLTERESSTIVSEEWDKKYKEFPTIRHISVIKDLDILKEYLAKNSKYTMYEEAPSHKSIYPIVDRISKTKNIEIVNIDFHHDYYHHYIKGEEYNCGNWLRVIKDERPNTKIKWVRREDSQTVSLDGEFPYSHTTDIESVLKDSYDIIFLCFSPEWTPPHLEKEYRELIECLKRSEKIC